MGYLDGSYVLGQMPPPPPLPKYDPAEEAPKWSLERIFWGVPVDKGPIPFAKLGKTPEPGQPDWRGVVKEKVIEWEMPEPYKFGQYNDPKYFFFDTPDYADPFKKLKNAAYIFAKTGFLFGTGWYGFALQEKVTLASFTEMMRKITLPWFFAGMAAATTVITVANLRGKKDDYYNYAIAGAVFGSIIGRKNHLTWTRHTILWTGVSIGLKHQMETNGAIIPVFNPRALNFSLSGNSANDGLASGDMRFGIRSSRGDPGRDLRTPY